MNLVNTNKLKEHDKNGYYFTDVEGEKYEEIRRSIEVNGIRDPIKVMQKLEANGDSSYIVISGHQRLRIARDLGMEKIPVEVIPDISDDEAEYLLIAENVERRGQAETDPIKKSRIANFLKGYWGVRDGRPNKLDHNGTVSRTTIDIAETIGETERTTKRILKLNDLIPELQELVSQKKLGTTAAEQLAHLSEDEQKALIEVEGEDVSKTTVSDAKNYREESRKSEGDIESYKRQISDLSKEKQLLEQRLEEEQDKPPKIIKKVVEVDNTDYETIDRLSKQVEDMQDEFQRLSTEKQNLQDRVVLMENENEEYHELQRKIENLNQQKDDLHRQIESATSLSTLYADIEYILQNKLAPVKYSKALTERRDSKVAMNNLRDIIEVVEEWVSEMKMYLPDENIINAEVIDNE